MVDWVRSQRPCSNPKAPEGLKAGALIFIRNHKEADSENEGRMQPTAAAGMHCLGCRCMLEGGVGVGLGVKARTGSKTERSHPFFI